MASPKRGGPANNKDDRKSPARGGPRGSTTRATARAPRARGAAQERQPMKPGGGVNTVGAPGRLPAWALTARKPVAPPMATATGTPFGDPRMFDRRYSEEDVRRFALYGGRGPEAPFRGYGMGSPHARFPLEGGGADFVYPGRAEMEMMRLDQEYPNRAAEGFRYGGGGPIPMDESVFSYPAYIPGETFSPRR